MPGSGANDAQPGPEASANEAPPAWQGLPAITVETPGYLGNRLIRYFVAHALAVRLGGAVVANFAFPEWGFDMPAVDPRHYRNTLLIERIEQLNFDPIAAYVRDNPSTHIVIRHFLQRQELFLSKEVYQARFPIISEVETFDERHLLINIRTGDILTGFVAWYPLIAVGFYRWIVAQTGLIPVFMGQLDDGPYVRQLRAAFPQARFVPSMGAIRDFDTIRRAANIVPSVSTFSVVAAWLSDARQVFLPLNGFLNPRHRPEIDLVPVEDPRYRFFLFPLNHALPEMEALAYHATIEGRWRELSRNQVRRIKAGPHVAQCAAAPESQSWPGFDETWYLHTYIDAAMEISDGWYATALEHFLDVGRLRGYRPGPSVQASALPNLSFGKRAWQSSLSSWSKGRTVEEDATNAVNGDLKQDYAFHTDEQTDPSWTVDLEQPATVKEVHIFNRLGPDVLRQRAAPLLVSLSVDGHAWQEFARLPDEVIFGSEELPQTPFVFRHEQGLYGRYVRLTAVGENRYLHLAQVEVFGYP